MSTDTPPWDDEFEERLKELDSRTAEIRRGLPASEKDVQKWLTIRKEVGRRIDPETADVTWVYITLGDPYGVDPVPEEWYVDKENFYRSPGSDVWVAFSDLPDATKKALHQKRRGDETPDNPAPFSTSSGQANRRTTH
jgi:hypothetical protein